MSMDILPPKLTQAELKSYWSRLSERYLSRDDDGLGVICYAGMPEWFNRFLDIYQRKAFARLLSEVDLSKKRILDLGTGVGRWANEFARWPQTDVVGIDIEPDRLRIARSKAPSITFLEMPVDKLDFPDASFDIVNSITVLQHVDDDVKRRAISESARILKPGGRAIVFELTERLDDAPHVYPWPRQTWEREFALNGFELERVCGDQYTPLLRLLKTGITAAKGHKARNEIDEFKLTAGAKSHSIQLTLLRLAVMASYPVEEVVRFLPSSLAKITGFRLVRAR